jgi:hypothetical protein
MLNVYCRVLQAAERLIRFVNRTNDYACYDHFDKPADAYQHEELCGNGCVA